LLQRIVQIAVLLPGRLLPGSMAAANLVSATAVLAMAILACASSGSAHWSNDQSTDSATRDSFGDYSAFSIGEGESVEHQPDPGWRRTSIGWVKVGSLGAAGLSEPALVIAAAPAVHPALLAAFLLLASLLVLSLEDIARSERSCSPLRLSREGGNPVCIAERESQTA